MTDPEDDPKIGLEDLNRRFKALTYEFYSQMVFLMKGAVLTVGFALVVEYPAALNRVVQELQAPSIVAEPNGYAIASIVCGGMLLGISGLAMHQQSILWTRMRDLSRNATS